MRQWPVGILLIVGLASCAPQRETPKAARTRPTAPPNVIVLTASNFEQEVLKSAKPVLVDFWATWCGPCKLISPIVEDLSVTQGDRLRVGKLDHGPRDDPNPVALAQRIRSLPTLVLYRDGKEVDRFEGVPRDDADRVITAWVEKTLAMK